jgi:fumarate reductase flavoprotein subunit
MERVVKYIILAVIWLGMAVPANEGFAANEETDVIVTGAGAAGLSAALTAANGGAKVILFEKMPTPGGTTNFAEGLFAAESVLQREHLSGPTKDEAFRDAMKFNHWRANPDIVRAFIDKSSDTIDWLMSQGVEFEPFAPGAMWPQGPRTWHVIKGHGAALIKALVARATENKNISVYYSSPVKKLITDDKNRVVGVVAEDKSGNTMEVKAKAVILSTAGFANNTEWMKKYTGHGDDVVPVGQMKKMGDGIRMAMEVGAETVNMETLQYLGVVGVDVGLMSPITAALWQPVNLWVNAFGKRFCDEATIAWEWTFSGNIISQQKDGVAYVVFDESIMKSFMEKGIIQGIGVIVPPTSKLAGLDKALETAISKGNVHIAGSVKELADKIKVDKQTLSATLKSYNDFCGKGHDDGYAKDQQYLWPLKGPKYYAVLVKPAHIGTLGGLKINEKTEVINKSWEVIPGLYAAGTCTGGYEGDTYDLGTSGGTLGYSINTGRIAGENALKSIGK